MKRTSLGVLGGLGPAASARFYSLVTEFTKANCDQEHIEIIIHSAPSTPDRTAFITGKSFDNPFFKMKAEISKLAYSGVGVIAVPCNTAEYFYDDLQKISKVPIISMVDKTVEYVSDKGAKKIGILATDGAISAGIYQNACRKHDICFETLTKDKQFLLNHLIYDCLKKSFSVPEEPFLSILSEFCNRKCDTVVLGCTELSQIYENPKYADYNLTDSLGILAAESVEMCGYELSDRAKKYINNKSGK